MTKQRRTRTLPAHDPETDPMQNPLQSRRFWISIATVVLNAIVATYPPLMEVKEQLIPIFVTLGMTLVGGFSLTHAVGRVESVVKSRRFWTAVGTGILTVGVALFPGLEAVQTDLIAVIGWAGVALIGGLTVTDFAFLKGWSKHK